MKVSIVVPAFNEAKLLAATLRSIKRACAAFAERAWEFEVIVCDNNSTDATAELARAEGAQVVFEPINQISRARNRGASVATGDWLIFVDADSHPSAELFADAAGEIVRGKCIGGGCTIALDQPLGMANTVVAVWNAISRMTRWAAGSFIFCETAAFRRINGFSEELFVSEELDLSRRLKKLGRATGRKMIILRAHPLVTSARKMHLYTPFEHLRFLLRGALFFRRTMRDRQACQPWYDGRR